METFANFINGKNDIEGNELRLSSPIDGTPFGVTYEASEQKTLEAIDAAEEAFAKWSNTPLKERQKILSKLVDIVQEKSERYALLESMNTGKTLRQSTFMDVTIAIEHMRYFANTREFKEKRMIKHPEFPGTKGIVEYRPMGVVAGVAPWNVPLLMAVWKIMPALLTGNTVVLKPTIIHPPLLWNLHWILRPLGSPRVCLTWLRARVQLLEKPSPRATRSAS